jgi:hypothetical protein
MSEMYNSLDELNQQRLAGAFETDAEYYQEREKLVQYYQEKLTQYSELYGTSLTTDARVVADAWSTTFMKTSVPMSEMNAAVQDYLKETDRLFDNWTAIGKAATEVFGSSMDDTKVKVNNVVSAVGDLADKLGGDNGVIDKVGQLLDKFSGEEGLLTQMSELSSSIDESITKYAGQLKNVNDELDKLAKYNGKIPGMPTVNNVAGMSGDQLKNVIAEALKEVGFKPADSSYDKTITDWNILGPYYEVLEAMKRSGYATSDDDLGKLHKSMGTNLKA